MSTICDSELADISAAQRNDPHAWERLLAAYRPLIDKWVREVVASMEADRIPIERSRVEGEACYAFWKAVIGYRAQKEGAATLGAYARVCVRNRLTSVFLRGSQKHLQTIPLEALEASRGGAWPLAEGAHELPSDRLEEAEALDALYRRIRAVVSDYEFSVFKMWAAGSAVSVVAERLGRDVKSVSNALARCKAKLRRALA